MIISKYLIIGVSEYRGAVQVALRDREPRLKGNEIALRLELQIPDALFKRPTLEAKMVVPNEAVPKHKITPQIVDNIEAIIKESTGLNISLNLVEAEKPADSDDIS